MNVFGLKLVGAYMVFSVAAALPGGATVIDFEAQTANTGGSLSGIADSPLTIGPATFNGGELRNGEIGLNADHCRPERAASR
ncbi:MAG TPA: hypothetical protein VHZ55_21765 [Bryobacteraceae bacterium]|nr:hypothetical protein [Bryobacteraceae bacterium]